MNTFKKDCEIMLDLAMESIDDREACSARSGGDKEAFTETLRQAYARMAAFLSTINDYDEGGRKDYFLVLALESSEPGKFDYVMAIRKHFTSKRAAWSYAKTVVDKNRNPIVVAVPEGIAKQFPTKSCDACGGKQYLLASRYSGIIAVERCDSCAGDLTNHQAADLARKAGWVVMKSHPYAVLNSKPGGSRDPWKVVHALVAMTDEWTKTQGESDDEFELLHDAVRELRIAVGKKDPDDT